MSLEEAEKESTKSDSDEEAHVTGSMVKSSKVKKLKKFDFVTEDGRHIHLSEEQINNQKKLEVEAKAEAAKQEREVRKVELIDLLSPEVVHKRHQGPGADDHARSFSSFLLAKVDKRNLNPLKQMRTIEQLRQQYRNDFTQAAIRNNEATLKAMEHQTGQLTHIVRERALGTFPSSTETNPQDQDEHVSYDDELKKEAPIPKAVVIPYSSYIPFASQLVDRKSVDQDVDVLTSLKRLKVNIPHMEALREMRGYSRHLEDLLKNKSRIDDGEKAKMNEWCFLGIENTLPSK
ncbi:hypothetical protein Tco_1274454 [Tanacetum coccineum]